MVRTYEGTASGKGAISEWTSKGCAGQGRMEITDSVPARIISIRVDWVKPFQAHDLNQVHPGTRFDFHEGHLEKAGHFYRMKLMGVFVNMDRMMGKHFESGLDNLKALAEK
jgi:hypothetical protein